MEVSKCHWCHKLATNSPRAWRAGGDAAVAEDESEFLVGQFGNIRASLLNGLNFPRGLWVQVTIRQHHSPKVRSTNRACVGCWIMWYNNKLYNRNLDRKRKIALHCLVKLTFFAEIYIPSLRFHPICQKLKSPVVFPCSTRRCLESWFTSTQYLHH